MRLGGGDIDVGNSYIVQIAVTDVVREREERGSMHTK